MILNFPSREKCSGGARGGAMRALLARGFRSRFGEASRFTPFLNVSQTGSRRARPSPVTRQILKFCLLRSPRRWLPRCRRRLCAISRRLGLECSRLTWYTLIVNVNANAKCQMPIRNSRMGLGAWTGRRPDDAHDEQTRVPRARSARRRLFRGRCGGLPRQVLRHVLGRSMDG